ncbi:MAG: hypothetical protein ACOYMG_14785 [Candidatus Methylumidiphilus sp.]
MSDWGEHHWACFHYIQMAALSPTGFQIGMDPHLRATKETLEVLVACPCPSQVRSMETVAVLPMAGPMSTRIGNGQIIAGHDDWHCCQDMQCEGLFDGLDDDSIVCGDFRVLSAKGMAIALEVMSHYKKWRGFRGFAPVTK